MILALRDAIIAKIVSITARIISLLDFISAIIYMIHYICQYCLSINEINIVNKFWSKEKKIRPLLFLLFFLDIGGNDNGLNGFGEFIYENIVPATFMAPMRSTFDLTDAQTILVGLP